MIDIKLSKDDKERMVDEVKTYFIDELNHDIGGFEAEFLIDFMAKKLGPYFYNKGLSDAHALFTEKTEDIGYLMQELEKPTD